MKHHFPTFLNKTHRSPAGGWWSRPKTWKSNTLVAAFGMAVTLGAVWKVSADKEVLDVDIEYCMIV